jgi:hypothetical protein
MELEELKNSWDSFEKKIEQQRSIDKEILRQIILKRPESRLKWMRFQSIYSIMVTPLVLFIVLPKTMKFENSYSFWLAASILVFFLIYSMIRGFLYYKKINDINVYKDTVLETRRKIILIKRFFRWGMKANILILPLLLIAITFWSGMDLLNPRILLFSIVLCSIILIMNRIQPQIYIFDRLDRVEDELSEIKELEKQDQ